MKPTTAVSPRAARVIVSSALRFASMKADLKTRSSGGYPGTASSGKATRPAPRARARSMPSTIRRTLPSKSPTVGLIWARAILSRLMGVVSWLDCIMRHDVSGRPMIRILVVDDDGKVREVVAAMLAALGHTVLEAPDGLAAITMLEAKSAVDLVLTDLVMPGLSGWDLVKTIRRRWPLVRVAVVTGNHDIATAQAGQAVEFVIKKPFGLDTLQRVLGKGA